MIVLLDISKGYAPVASNIERKYYLTTLGELFDREKIGESVSKYKNEVEEKGSFKVAERLWALNANTDLEVVHKRLLIERREGLEKAPSIEAKATSSAIMAWLVISTLFYGLSVLVWRVLLKVYRNWPIESKQSGIKPGKNQHPDRSKAGWSGRV